MEETKETQKSSPVQTDWHSGFAGGLELSFRRYRGQIEIEREHLLSKEPLQIDFLLINKKPGMVIENAVGKGFRQHNIIEYKNPNDELNIDVVWKIIGYASIYKSISRTVDGISIDEITVSIFRSRKPKKLFRELQEKGYEVSAPFSGGYNLRGLVIFPVRVVVTSELEDKDFLSLRIMRENADEREIREFISTRNTDEMAGDRQDIDAVLRVAASVNKELFEQMRGDESMNDVLREIMMDDIIAAEEQGATLKLIKQIMRKIEKEKSPEVIAEELEEELDEVKRIYDVVISCPKGSTPNDIYSKMKEIVSVS